MADSILLCSLECAGFDKIDGRIVPCRNAGTSACSACKLVKYCSKEHQTVHWRGQHKSHCKSKLRSAAWEPSWQAEGRQPSFMVSDGEPLSTSFGGRRYIWGNTPAIDCLNVDRNEGEKAKNADFSLCFAASGDIRNVVKTVNALPSKYIGTCKILVNDRDPTVFNRNLTILLLLLHSGMPYDEAAEIAVHMSYSLRLTPRAATKWADSVRQFFSRVAQFPSRSATFSTNGSTLEIHSIADVCALLWGTLQSNLSMKDAQKGMRDALQDPSRQDHRDRYYSNLRPSHRLAACVYRTTGMVLPFGAHLDDFSLPNKTIFSPWGDWLSPDSADPLQCWDIKETLATGLRHGTTEEDIYGALFFHAKEQFAEFARRVHDFKILICVTPFDACDLAAKIKGNHLAPNFPPACFDRIETSNIADYHFVGIERVLADWGPLLSRTNTHAALITHFMNWHVIQTGGSISANTTSVKGGQRAARDAMSYLRSNNMITNSSINSVFTVMANIDLFHDNNTPFEQFMGDTTGADKTASQNKLRRRKRHTVVPKRIGLSLDKPMQTLPKLDKESLYLLGYVQGNDWSDRYAEFEVAA